MLHFIMHGIRKKLMVCFAISMAFPKENWRTKNQIIEQTNMKVLLRVLPNIDSIPVTISFYIGENFYGNCILFSRLHSFHQRVVNRHKTA